MVTCSGELPCLELAIFSLTLRVFCMAWSGIHISRAALLFIWIVQCIQCVHLQCMCEDELVIKKSERFELFITMAVSDGENPVVVFVFDLF